MSEFLREGGAGMIPTLLLGFLLVASAAHALVRPERRVQGRLASLGVATFAAGMLGTCLGMVAAFRYAPQAPGGEQVTIALAGMSEALHCVVMALVLIVVGSLLAYGATLRSTEPLAESTRPRAAV